MFESGEMLKQLPFLNIDTQTSEFVFFLVNHFNLLAGCIKMFKNSVAFWGNLNYFFNDWGSI